MKVSHHLARLEPMVLHPVRGIAGADWHRAPDGKWSIAQIMQHLAIGIDLVGEAFEGLSGEAPMERQSKPYQSALRHLTLGIGKYPGTLKALPHAKPDAKPDPELVAAQFRMGVEQYRTLAAEWPTEKQLTRFVSHPVLGELNFPEWVRFHYLHCRHHATEIDHRVKWIKR
jgi:hypothetical protein